MSYTDSSHLGNKENEWLKTLDFYKEEIALLQKRLEEVNAKNTDPEARAGAEHFQNQFIVQRNNIDELYQSIHRNTHEAFTDIKDHAGKVETSVVAKQDKIGDNVAQFEKIVSELRHEFNLYLSKWM